MGLCKWIKSFSKPKEPEPVEPPNPGPTPPTPVPGAKGQKFTVFFGTLDKFQKGRGDLKKAIEGMGRFQSILFPWDCCLTNPDVEWQYDEAKEAIAALKGKTKIMGYLPLGKSEQKSCVDDNGKFFDKLSREYLLEKAKVWKDMGAEILFWDMWGDDYGTTDADQEWALNVSHALGLPVCMNGWRVDQIYNERRRLPVWPGRDLYMFEDLGKSPTRDAEKWKAWNLANKDNILTVGIAYGVDKNQKTDDLGKLMDYFGYSGKHSYDPDDGVIVE